VWPEKLAVRRGDHTEFVHVTTIDWIEADGDYVRLHAGGRTHLLSLTLAALLDQLDPVRFVQIHRSRIVSLPRVTSVRRGVHGEYLLHLANGQQLASGRSFTKTLAPLFRN
jgi:two-component system LytT family response regulator